ncbi:MAG: spore coat protein CotH [Lachnospiraceae bacterium]|nr:spore coat protein CotH [Lachnospiraceae bacterium]
MSTHKQIDRICAAAFALSLLLAFLFLHGEAFGLQAASSAAGYASKLFDASAVHRIDIRMDDWEGFLASCTEEAYVSCAVVIDGDIYKNAAIRAKGNTSLSQVEAYGNNRYSFKIEFDHYEDGRSYYGLDKLCLNNLIQDNTCIKDYLCYRMMGEFGVAAPLCSFVYITVNGEDFGLYLAVEGIEESFLQRNYGSGYGELYKPDSQQTGGGAVPGGRPDGEMTPGGRPDGEPAPDRGAMPERSRAPENDAGGGMRVGSDDVRLVYTDDDYDSYANIFENAKTDISDGDKDRLIDSLRNLNENEKIEEVVNVEAVIRYFVVHNFVLNFDSYTGSMIHNYYLYEKDGQMEMLPWDYNLAFGAFEAGADAEELVNAPIDTPVSGDTVDARPMLAWIFSEEEWTDLYHDYFTAFVEQYFDSGYLAEQIDAVKTLIAPYVEKDPTKFCTYEEFETGIDTLKEFCLLRAESIRGQLDGTIASTEEGQRRDSSSRIDVGSLSISDMGSMGVEGFGPKGGAEGKP